jgi:solute carrier family 25 protein 16
MPLGLVKDAAPPAILNHRPREMGVDESARRRQLAVCPTDDDAITPERKKRDKQSFDYIWRTGLAGGLAGCAVCSPFSQIFSNEY